MQFIPRMLLKLVCSRDGRFDCRRQSRVFSQMAKPLDRCRLIHYFRDARVTQIGVGTIRLVLAGVGRTHAGGLYNCIETGMTGHAQIGK